MNSWQELLYNKSPSVFRDLAVTAFDLQYYRRRAGVYKAMKALHDKMYYASLDENLELQRRRMRDFLSFVRHASRYYGKTWDGIDLNSVKDVSDLHRLPLMDKEQIRLHVKEVRTVLPRQAYIGHTGGTTGMSLEVYYHWHDMQERMAVLDSLRGRFGYQLGMPIAWFSGKTLLAENDVKRQIFWRTDHWFKIRYYSTFHMSEANLSRYLEDIDRFKPSYFSGFPSLIHQLADFAVRKGYKPARIPKAVFTTAETLVPAQAEKITEAFQCPVVDHYSSSEGAPWIVQCSARRYHFLPTTGVIEVLDGAGRPASSGQMVVTSFATRGTPLVRYKIGDTMAYSADAFSGKKCECGSACPVVEGLQGRFNDYLYSEERGIINIVNVANSVKYAKGIIKFQARQSDKKQVLLLLVTDPAVYGSADERNVLKEFQERLGPGVTIKIQYVEDIPRERSGKHRMIINSIQSGKG